MKTSFEYLNPLEVTIKRAGLVYWKPPVEFAKSRLLDLALSPNFYPDRMRELSGMGKTFQGTMLAVRRMLEGKRVVFFSKDNPASQAAFHTAQEHLKRSFPGDGYIFWSKQDTPKVLKIPGKNSWIQFESNLHSLRGMSYDILMDDTQNPEMRSMVRVPVVCTHHLLTTILKEGK